jgi:hypothetical protein
MKTTFVIILFSFLQFTNLAAMDLKKDYLCNVDKQNSGLTFYEYKKYMPKLMIKDKLINLNKVKFKAKKGEVFLKVKVYYPLTITTAKYKISLLKQDSGCFTPSHVEASFSDKKIAKVDTSDLAIVDSLIKGMNVVPSKDIVTKLKEFVKK